MLRRLVWASLVRHRARSILAVLGVAVSAAMLLDMVMLSSGMRASFKNLLLSQGFQIRLSPKGTLPFDTDATIGDAAAITAKLRTISGVVAVSPVLGGQVYATAAGRTTSAIALGVDPAVQGDYEITAGNGRSPQSLNEFVASEDFMRVTGARLGDTLSVAAGFDPQLRAVTGQRSLILVGRAHFIYLPAAQNSIALPLSTLQAMRGEAARDRASLFMVRAASNDRVDSVLTAIERTLPQVTAVSIETAMRQVDERLSYFRQLAVILGAVSLGVGFLLVTTLVTVSVNERLGEIVVMRAIGVARGRVVLQVLLESSAIMLVGALAGLGLGLVTARYLNSILASFPGLPAAIDFFLFEPRDAWAALGLLALAGVLAGIYPSWHGASLPIAMTLREEAAA